MVRRTFDLLERYKTLFPNKTDAFAGKQNGMWVKCSTHDYIEKSNFISYALLALGFKVGDKIATVSNNRPEWNFVDMGMAQVGVVHIPIYPTISTDDYTYIFHNAEPRMVFVSDKMLYEKLKPLVAPEFLKKGLEKSLPARHHNMIPENEKAVEIGKSLLKPVIVLN